MTGFIDRLAAHAQGTAPVLRLRPRSRFEEVEAVRPGPVEALVEIDDLPDKAPAAVPATQRLAESRSPVPPAAPASLKAEEPVAAAAPPEQSMQAPIAEPGVPIPDAVRVAPRRRALAAEPQPPRVRWPAIAEIGRRLTTALRDAGLLRPVDGREAPAVRWPDDAIPEEADLDVRLAAVTRDADPAERDVHLHVHLDRVEVLHAAPPAPTRTVRRADPPVARRPTPSVDHDAYLARRREDRR